jgi:hypothetical protein
MDQGDASLVVSHEDILPENSFTVEGRVSGVRYLKSVIKCLELDCV